MCAQRDDYAARPGWYPAAALLILALLLALPAPARAQQEAAEAEAPAAAAPTTAPTTAPATTPVEAPAGDLVAAIEARFEVLPTREGLLLRPLASGLDLRSIEIAGGEVAVDGVVLGADELTARLGDAAPLVERLAALSPSEARSRFGLGSPLEQAPPALDVTQPSEALQPPEAPEPPAFEAGQRVSLGSSVTVPEGEVAEQAVAIFGNVRVAGEVTGDAVAVGGSMHVDGKVAGKVTAVGGSVFLGPHSEVGGEVTSVGGRVERDPGAQVGGNVSEVAMGSDWGRHGPWSPRVRFHDNGFGSRLAQVGDVFSELIGFAVLLLLAWLVILVARGAVDRVSAKVENDFWMSLLAGLLTAVLLGPVLVVVIIILVISVIGIPLLVLVPVALLALALAALLGYTSVARLLGQTIQRRFGWSLHGVFLPLLVGVAALEVWGVLSEAFGVIGGPLGFIAWMLWLFGAVLQLGAWLTGLGAVILTRFGAGPRTPVAAAALSPPPASPPPPATLPPAEGEG